MAQFRKKPVVIEAVQWNGYNYEEIAEFMTGEQVEGNGNMELRIPTLEGDHIARQDDWIIKGIRGEFYPCKPDIFAATYDPL